MTNAIECQNLARNPINGPLPINIDGFEQLVGLALDMRWSWDHSSDSLWRALDEELWELTRNPWAVLQTVSHSKIEALLKQPEYCEKVKQLLKHQQHAHSAPAWFQQQQKQDSKPALTCVAYFSMEFMLSNALPIYSGGLGNVAGDQLKAASDLGVPVIGIGLLYQQDYFRQLIDKDGIQKALYPYNDPGQLPIAPLREANGDWLRLKVNLSGHPVWLRAWQAQVGRVKLYLLDSNDAVNSPTHRGITSELYGGDSELRLQQELLLGMGGWRLLEALNIEPEVCHLNEGHAAFVVLERAHSFMVANTQPFEVALTATRAGNIFTTHTAVDAGFDRFSPQLIEQYLSRYATQRLGISMPSLLALGRKNPKNTNELFNMAYLAIRGSGSVNGVSRLHETVSRHLFEPLFPRWPHAEIPIGHITNGVHMPTWDSLATDELWTSACGKDRWRDLTIPLENKIQKISDEKLWACRNTNRDALVKFIRIHLVRQLAAAGAHLEELDEIKNIFNPDVLTLGFARRFATYKRTNLLLHDRNRLLHILSNPGRPVQLVIAGKAHPKDTEGQALIQEWIHFIRQENVRLHVVFLSDYDMRVAEQLVQGVDVWINTPRRPWEASGTSGMKVLVNGGLNLSELDGWWAEAYAPELGWALGDGLEHSNYQEWDAQEANTLYELLEQEIIPEFYDRDQQALPRAWLQRIRASMEQLTPRFSVMRTVREYVEQNYIPAAKNYRKRAAAKGQISAHIVSEQYHIQQHWDQIQFGERRDNVSHTINNNSNSDQQYVEVDIFTAGLTDHNIRLELYAEATNGADASCIPMQLVSLLTTQKTHIPLQKLQTPIQKLHIPITLFYPTIGPWLTLLLA